VSAPPALGLVELSSIALGIVAGDAMAKRAPVSTLHAGTVHPGKYLVLVSGDVAAVDEALAAGRLAAGGALLGELFLPAVDPAVVEALRGARRGSDGEALGIVETRTVASTLQAADAGVKGAAVELLEVRLADGLGGKAFALFGGQVTDVEAAVEQAIAVLASPAEVVAHAVIAQLHPEMRLNLRAHAEFGERVRAARI
jgi:microcompartment protein CcmL/EutN